MLDDILYFPSTETRGFLEGPLGPLETVVTPAALSETENPRGLAIVCHPHPLLEGTMNNKVVTTTVRACRDLGLHAIRFNFRGVGESAGEYGEAVGECEDLKAVRAWAMQQLPDLPVILAGFSFGSFIAASVAMEFLPKQLILIAPAVSRFDFTVFPRFECPTLVIQGEQDEVVPPEEVYAFCANHPEIVLERLPESGHFFHRQLIPLKNKLEIFL